MTENNKTETCSTDNPSACSAPPTGTLENWWGRDPEYRVDIVPAKRMVRAWFGDLLLAESSDCLIVHETRHVDRIYFPEKDVRWELFTATDHRTQCPYKGIADYWSLTGVEPTAENILWAYRTPFDEVGAIKGHIGFYHERMKVVVDDHWPGDAPDHVRHFNFPLWGDQQDLQGLMDAQKVAEHHYQAPPYRVSHIIDNDGLVTARNVVEGGQLLGGAIVAASREIPDQRVSSGYMIFSRATSFDKPIDQDVKLLKRGNSFSSVEVIGNQENKQRYSAMFLFDVGGGEVVRNVADMPKVPGPLACPHLDFSTTGRELRIVDGAYDQHPDRIGPPEIMAWRRFRDAPQHHFLHTALMAQSTTHWTIAAGLRPHKGIGEAQAHKTLSTGPVSISIAFHDEVDVTQWLLYANRAIWSGNGKVQGQSQVFTEDGRMVASFSVQAMVRPLTGEHLANVDINTTM